MILRVVRHLKVNLKYEEEYNSENFTKSQADYDAADIIEYPDMIPVDFHGPVYVSDLRRTHLTLKKKFNVAEFNITPLIREVPLKAFKDSPKVYKKAYWGIIGRVHWFLNKGTQGEDLRDTLKRANQFIDLLEEKHKNDEVLVVTHGVFMKVFSYCLKRRGFKGKYIFGLAKNGQEFVYTKDYN